MSEIKEMFENFNTAFMEFRGRNDQRILALEKSLDGLETALAASQFPGGGGNGRLSSASAREHFDAFLAWARKGENSDGLRGLEVKAALSVDVDPSGGFLVPDEMEKSIERLAAASVAMRRLARIVTAKGEYQKPLSKGGATGGWVAERGARTETDTPELDLFSPPFCEIYAMPKATQKLLDMSSFDIAAWLVEEIGDVFTATEGAGFITGNGVGQVHGIIDDTLMVADASWEYLKTGYIAGGHATLLNNADKLIDLQHALKPVYRANGTWLMNDVTLSVIRKFKDGEGNYLWRPGLLADAPDTLLGKPVFVDDFMPDIGANAYPVAFGDFQRAYTIVDHMAGTRMLRDPYSEKGYVLFYTMKRIAAGISNYEALKFLKIATS